MSNEDWHCDKKIGHSQKQISQPPILDIDSEIDPERNFSASKPSLCFRI